jgi:hypothetical protein
MAGYRRIAEPAMLFQPEGHTWTRQELVVWRQILGFLQTRKSGKAPIKEEHLFGLNFNIFLVSDNFKVLLLEIQRIVHILTVTWKG